MAELNRDIIESVKTVSPGDPRSVFNSVSQELLDQYDVLETLQSTVTQMNLTRKREGGTQAKLSVMMILKDQQGKILLVESGATKGPRKLELVGGGVDETEASVWEAFKREAEEEAGLDQSQIQFNRIIDVYKPNLQPGNIGYERYKGRNTPLYIIGEATIIDPNFVPKPTDKEVSAVNTFSPREARERTKYDDSIAAQLVQRYLNSTHIDSPFTSRLENELNLFQQDLSRPKFAS